MNRRSEELSSHLVRHLHLAQNVHAVNMHREDHTRMLDPRQLPLRRELRAVKKVKSLQDPSTSSSYSFSPRDSREYRASNNGHGGLASRRTEGFLYRENMDEFLPRSELFLKGERWQGDAAEIAKRLIAEQKRRIMSSPGALPLLDDVTTGSDSFLESEDGEAGLISEHLSNSAGSPLVIRGHRNRRRWKDGSASARGRRAVKEELEITCGMPWYKPTSSANKYKSKSLLNYACAIPEPKKSVELQPPAREVQLSGCEDDAQAPQVRNSSMSYKYRPRSFKDMVGQTLVVRSLATAITKGRLSQLYLFAGPRGTGKTSLARVFAAALVCLNVEPHRRPCGLCRECATLTLNRSRDVKEIDVAGLPDALLNVSHARQQVFIVKGCESLAMDLWTKLLDELPMNVVVILIATDLERLPASATSRCQKYHFGKLKEAEILPRLRFLVEKEKLDVEDAALSLIASRAEGSLRDAEMMLDQLSLLDQTITLSMVQELSGLIPDEKLVELLDMALGADTVNTVKTMRALLDAGVDALSLVTQLASLITNILAGTFELRRDKHGFFHRNLPKREEQQRLRQALKVLAESEKQLRVSNDRPTWLTAALLQFAPDKSYLPSSVDTSPIAFDTLERLDDQPCTPRLPPPQPAARKHSQKSSSSTDQGQKDKEKAVDSVAFKLVQADDRFDVSRGGNRDFKVLSLRDMEHIWDKVLDGCRSNVLRQLLSSHATLTALSITTDDTFAVAHVEFQTSEHKARAERLRSSTCHAFQMALGCPVELKLSLQNGSSSAPTNDSPHLHNNMQTRSSSRHEMLTGLAARSRRLADAAPGPRLSSASDYKYCFPAAHGSSCRYRPGRRPPLTRANSLDAPVVKVRWKHPKFKGTTSKTRKLKPRRRRTGIAALCWQSPLSELERPRNVRFFLRLVPCGRSTKTIGSPNAP